MIRAFNLFDQIPGLVEVVTWLQPHIFCLDFKRFGGADFLARDESKPQRLVYLKDLPDFRISASSFSRTSSYNVIVVLVGTPWC